MPWEAGLHLYRPLEIAGIVFACALVSGPVLADAVSDFYAGPGKQMKIIIRDTTGSNYDMLSRLVARHMGPFIPGEPYIIPVNMVGGGGLIAANYVGTIAPRDGTILSIVGQGLIADQALGLSPQFQGDLRQFNWVANIESSNQIIVVWHTSPTQTIEDAKHRETTVGATGGGEASASVQYPAFFNNVLGTKFKIILGYTGGPQINLAMERGEVEGRGTNTYASYVATTPHYIEKKLIRPLIQTGLRKDPAMPDVPLLLDQDLSADKRALAEFMSKSSTVGRPLGTTPGVPAERVAALRKAFAEMAKDRAFIADARSMKFDLNPTSGEELAQLINDIIGAPEDVRKRMAPALVPKESLDKK